MKKILPFIICAAIAFAACEKKEYWEHPTPNNPVIAHLMCIEITQAPNGYSYGIALANAETGVESDRFNVGVFGSPGISSIKFYTDGGQRLDREAYVMAIVGVDEAMENFVTYADTVPQFINGSMIYKNNSIGLPTEYTFSNDTISGKWYFRYD